MREYVTGDDLRRIHWPSVARTGQLMIRQDEATRRSSATVFVDNRVEMLGGHGAQSFERAISVAGSLGRALVKAGFTLRLATADSSPTIVTEETLLDALAGLGPSHVHGAAEVLRGLRDGSLADTTLALVSAPPAGPDVATISRVGLSFGRKLAVFVYPVAPRTLTPDASDALRSRASAAQVSLQRAGWEVHVMPPDGRLAETWKQHTTRKLEGAGSFS
jgi:uncharacterized protein (DUF58 family)